jgi:hypothetical protein
MDVHEFLKQLPVRSNNRLEPYREEIHILYSGNASFSAIRKYLRDEHGVSVTRQSVWEFCKRHFSELSPARHSSRGAPVSGPEWACPRLTRCARFEPAAADRCYNLFQNVRISAPAA